MDPEVVPSPADTARGRETVRLDALRSLMLLDTPAEPMFDTLVRLAAEACGSPIALISLVDENRQWFKAGVGLPGVSETAREHAFCAHAIGSPETMEVDDAAHDPRFADNPLVTGAPHIRHYAGAPLTLPDGEAVGTLCVIDRRPRHLSAEQLAKLASLADLATQAMLMRRDLIERSIAVRSRYEQALAESEGRYRALVEEQEELVSLALPSGEIVFANRSYAAYHGFASADDMVGRNLFEFVDPDDRDAVRREIDSVLDGHGRTSMENRIRSSDGRDSWIAWTNQLQRDHRGLTLIHSVGRDVTARRAAEAALRASQSLLQRTGRVAGVGGWELEIASGKLTWSEQTKRIHEVGLDHVPTLESAIAFYAPEVRDEVRGAVERAIHDASPWDLELPLVTATGRSIWVRALGEVEFEHGAPVRLVGAFQEISERKRLQDELARSERFLRNMTDSLPIRLAYVDREARFVFVNRAHCERFGLAQDAIVGHTRSELTGGASDAVVEPRVAAALRGERQRFEYDDVVGGRTLRIESQLLPDVDADGTVRGFFTTGVDVTERSAAERALRELTRVLENSTDWVVQTDRHGVVSYMNPATRHALGLGAAEALAGRSFGEFNTPETNRTFAEVILPALKTRDAWLGETSVLVRGREVPVSHLVIAHRDEAGRIERFSAVMRDVSFEAEWRRQLMRQTATLQSVTEAIPAIVTVVDRQGRYRFVNHAFERWAGTTRDAVIGRRVGDVIGGDEFQRSREYFERALAGEQLSYEKRFPEPAVTRHLAISLTPLRLDDGSVDGVIGVAQDVTSQRNEEVRLLQLAQRDALTGLLNRAGFDERMKALETRDDRCKAALLCIDLDRFKPVNDQHGHPVGDQVLRQFADRVGRLVRPSDAVARLGGDEFAVILFGLREAGDAASVAAKIVDAAARPFNVGSHWLHIGASVGIAHGLDDAGRDAFAARADAALYRAKQAGRGRVAI